MKSIFFKIRFPVFVFLLISLHSCTDYLDVQPNASLEIPDNLGSLQRLLDASSTMNYNVPTYGEVSADDYYLKDATFNSLPEDNRRIYIWDRLDYFYNNDWAKGYMPVYSANLALETIGKLRNVDKNEQHLRDNVYGSALFYRAFQFLSLAWTYSKVYDGRSSGSDLGIVLKKTTDQSAPSVRATVEETYSTIISDLKESLLYLPEYPAHVMRPSQGSAYGVLARTYLSMSQYDSALYYVEKALGLHYEVMDFNDDPDIFPNQTYPFRAVNRETVFYAQLTTDQPHIHPSFGLVDSVLYRSYSNDDLRKDLFFRNNADGTVSFKGNFTGGANRFGGLTTAELYLIRSECRARLGNGTGALADLNYLLERRYRRGSFIPLQLMGDQLLPMILLERRKELLFRGLRWIDIKRLNLESPSLILKRTINGELFELLPNDNRFALPIPEDIIKLTGIPQNP